MTGCDTWDGFGFAGESFEDVPYYTVKFSGRPAGVCPVQAQATKDLGIIFRGPADAERDQLQRRCETYRANEIQLYQAAIDAQIRRAREKFATFSPVAPERTCIVDLLQRLHDDTTRFAVVITDGAENCVAAFRGPIPAPSMHKTVVMVVISPEKPQKASSAGQYFAQMRDKWLTIAPWLSAVVPVSGMDRVFESARSPVAESVVAQETRSRPR